VGDTPVPEIDETRPHEGSVFHSSYSADTKSSRALSGS
jgi:hypothetical protein